MTVTIGAVDIGGTKIAVGLIAEDGSILSQNAFPTLAERGFTDAIARIHAALEAQIKQVKMDLTGIGVGSTGPVDPISGEVGINDLLPGWQGFNLIEALQAAFGVSVALENDADAATLGEHAWGVGRNVSRFMYVTISTGIGSGLILDHELYRGVDGSHPEAGHHILDPNGPLCYCGARGCWESLASGTALTDWYNEQRLLEDPGASRQDASVICQLAGQGDPLARRAVDREAFYLGLGLANLASLFVPGVIALGGGVMRRWDLFAERACQVVLQNARYVPAEKVRILTASLGKDTGLVGAAQAWMNRYHRR